MLKALNILASTPTFPNKPRPSIFINATSSKTDRDLIPFLVEFPVIKVPWSFGLNVFNIRNGIFFSNKGIIVLACRIVVPKLASSFASVNDNSLIFLASATRSGLAV